MESCVALEDYEGIVKLLFGENFTVANLNDSPVRPPVNIEAFKSLISLSYQYQRDEIYIYFIEKIFFNGQCKFIVSNTSNIKEVISEIMGIPTYRNYFMTHPDLYIFIEGLAILFGSNYEEYLDDVIQYALEVKDSKQKLNAIFKSLYWSGSVNVVEKALNQVGYLFDEDDIKSVMDWNAYYYAEWKDERRLVIFMLDWILENNYTGAISKFLESLVGKLDFETIKLVIVQCQDIILGLSLSSVGRCFGLGFLSIVNLDFADNYPEKLKQFNQIIKYLKESGITFQKSSDKIIGMLERTVELIKN